MFSLPLYVKEWNTLTSDQCHVLNLVVKTTDSEASFFPTVTPQDILKNKDGAEQKVTDALNLLTKFNVWLEATVAVSQTGQLYITDATRLKKF